MADAFYPFVGEGPADIPGLATPAAGQQGNVADTQPTPAPGAVATQNPTPENSQIGDPMATPQPPASPAHAGARPETTPDPKVHVLGAVVSNPARIAVFDDPAAAPRVVVVQPKDIRTYLEEVTATVTRLAKEQGGRISFTVIREVVENLVHAYFIEPTISILDGGNTIRFSDQGPGISEKSRALEYGTTSATEEMKRYIRGVGSGLPYAQQYMEDHGGSLTIEDNIHSGTIVTISLPTAIFPARANPHRQLRAPQPRAVNPARARGEARRTPPSRRGRRWGGARSPSRAWLRAPAACCKRC